MSQKVLKEKLEMVSALVNECLQEIGSIHKQTLQKVTPAKTGEEPKPKLTLQIVNKVGDCDEVDAIQKQVLDARGAEARVLLPFYISHKYFKNEWLTSGEIATITSDLGVKIDIKNVSNYLITYRKYLESGATRKKGQPTPYRLNRYGVRRFEEIIHAKAI